MKAFKIIDKHFFDEMLKCCGWQNIVIFLGRQLWRKHVAKYDERRIWSFCPNRLENIRVSLEQRQISNEKKQI